MVLQNREVQWLPSAAWGELRFEVAVHNVAAGHNLPTGVTELREMWLDIRVTDAKGRTVFRSGELDAQGRLPRDAIAFGAVAADESGKATHKPWRMTRFLSRATGERSRRWLKPRRPSAWPTPSDAAVS